MEIKLKNYFLSNFIMFFPIIGNKLEIISSQGRQLCSQLLWIVTKWDFHSGHRRNLMRHKTFRKAEDFYVPKNYSARNPESEIIPHLNCSLAPYWLLGFHFFPVITYCPHSSQHDPVNYETEHHLCSEPPTTFHLTQNTMAIRPPYNLTFYHPVWLCILCYFPSQSPPHPPWPPWC